MILGLPVFSFCLILFLSFLCGALGAIVVLLIAKHRKPTDAAQQCESPRTGWQRISHDEQLHNGR